MAWHWKHAVCPARYDTPATTITPHHKRNIPLEQVVHAVNAAPAPKVDGQHGRQEELPRPVE